MKTREKQLIKNTVIVAVGKICTQFITFFLLPLYTYLLSTEEFGIVDLFNSIISLLLPIIFLQIEQAIFRFLIDARENDEEKSRLISTVIVTVTAQALLYFVFFVFISKYIHNEYKYYLLTNVIASMFSVVLLQISRGLGDSLTYSLGSLISGISTILFNVYFIVVLRLGAYGMLMASFLANVLCVLFVFIKKKLYQLIKIRNFNYSILKKIWKYSIPLVPNQISWWIVNASDRFIINLFLGTGYNGIYSSANKFSNICITFFNVFNLSWSESASLHIKDNDSAEFFSNIINKTIKIFSSLCIGIIAFMPLVFKIFITGNAYNEAYYQIPILMVSALFNIIVSLFGSIYVALKKSNKIAKTSIYAAVINVILNLLLIKRIGLYAASISTLISYLIMSIYRYISVKKYVNIKLDWNIVIKSVIVVCIILINYYSKNLYLIIINVIIAICFAVIYNKDWISDIYLILKNKFRIKCNWKI